MYKNFRNEKKTKARATEAIELKKKCIYISTKQ